MKKVFFIFLLILLFSVSVFTQRDERIMCPNVNVADAPQGARVGELITFKADVDTGGKEYELKYHWHVTQADDPRKALEIVSGQGTPEVTVVQVKGSVMATIEIGGIPNFCVQTSSEIAYVDLSPAGGDCPGIELTGSSKSLSPGELLEYTVYVETGGEEIKLEYIWAAVYQDAQTGKRKNAEIVSGQGTPDVRIKMPREGVTVSVIIGGIREECPMMASDTVRFAPTGAVLLEDLRGPTAKFDKARIEKIKAAQKNDPSAILYVFIGYKTVKSAKGGEKQAFLLENFSRHGRYRIVFFNVDEKDDVMQIWLVQPGTVYPKFRSTGGK